jgi:hypothetical protein
VAKRYLQETTEKVARPPCQRERGRGVRDRRTGGAGEGKDGLIEHHMARDEDPSGSEIKTPVPLLIWGVPEEDTQSGAGVQLMGGSGSGVGITRTPKHAEVIVPRRGTKEGVVWRGSGTDSGRKTVEEIGGSVQALGPEASRKRGLKQEGAHGVVGGANHPLSLAIL